MICIDIQKSWIREHISALATDRDRDREIERKGRGREGGREGERESEMVYQIFIDRCTNFARARISLKRLNLSSNVNASQKYEINSGYLTMFPVSAVRVADSRN